MEYGAVAVRVKARPVGGTSGFVSIRGAAVREPWGYRARALPGVEASPAWGGDLLFWFQTRSRPR